MSRTYAEIFGPYTSDMLNCDKQQELEKLDNISKLLLLQIAQGACAYARLRGYNSPDWQDIRDSIVDQCGPKASHSERKRNEK